MPIQPANHLNRFAVNLSVDGEVEEFVVELVLDPSLNKPNGQKSAEQLELEGARFARFLFENCGGYEFAAGFHQEFARLLRVHPDQVEALAA